MLSIAEAKEKENQNSAFSNPTVALPHHGSITENQEIFEEWKEWLNDSVSKGTIKQYTLQVEKMLVFLDKPIREINYRDLIKYIQHRNHEQERKWGRVLSRGTENGIKDALRKFWKYLTLPGIEIVDNNIALQLENKKIMHMGVSQEKILSVQEVKVILEQAQENPRDFALIAMLYYAGLRKTEAQQLVWGDIDFEGRIIYIRKGKGDKARGVTLNSDLARILQALQDRTGDRIGYVFKSKGGTYMSWRTIEYTVHKYAAKAGIKKKVNPHMFRHSHATHRIEHGGDIKQVSMDLGHQSVQITYDLYVHPTQEARRQGIDTHLPSFV